ncbi:MAG: hypothetical protein AAFU73_07590 [Planctomycetota bacterium]
MPDALLALQALVGLLPLDLLGGLLSGPLGFLAGFDLSMPLGLLPEDVYVRDGFGTRDYFNRTTVHPIGLAMLVSLSAMGLLCSRKYMLLPLLVLACLVPQGQRVVIATLDFGFIRLILLVLLGRIFLRGEWGHIRPKALDKVVFAWVIVGAIGNVLQVGNFGAVVYRAGLAFDILGMYLVCRVAFRDWRDVDRAVTWLGLLACVSFFFFALEKRTGRNLFSVMGGVPAFTGMRDGKLRAQGPFVHPILAGCFWAVLIPLVASKVMRRSGWQVTLGVVGTCAMLAIVVFSASSTPLMVLGCNGVGALVYRYRRHMRFIRWSVALGLLSLHLYMKQPVWHLLARIDLTGGSTGYHRYKLIQSSIDNFHEWWLCGIPSTAHWGYFMFDVTNQYVLEGVRSGVVAMLAFMWLLVWCFKHVGETWPGVERNRYLCLLSWALGVSMFSHMNVFLAVSVSHSAQSLLAMLLVLAGIAATAPVEPVGPLGDLFRRRRSRMLRPAPALTGAAAA